MISPSIFQLISPSLPVGSFSYSEGLEYLTNTQRICNESDLISWLESELLRGQLRIEAAALLPIRNCLKAWKVDRANASQAKVYEWNSWTLALRDSIEVRSQQIQMGKSLLQLLSDLNHPLPNSKIDLSWPLAWSWAGLSWSLPTTEVLLGYLYSWVANQLSASLRLLPIGPNKVQLIQYNLLPLIKSQAELLINKDPHELFSGDIGATMAQQSHNELYSRLFRS